MDKTSIDCRRDIWTFLRYQRVDRPMTWLLSPKTTLSRCCPSSCWLGFPIAGIFFVILAAIGMKATKTKTDVNMTQNGVTSNGRRTPTSQKKTRISCLEDGQLLSRGRGLGLKGRRPQNWTLQCNIQKSNVVIFYRPFIIEHLYYKFYYKWGKKRKNTEPQMSGRCRQYGPKCLLTAAVKEIGPWN